MIWTPARGHIILQVAGVAMDWTCECFQIWPVIVDTVNDVLKICASSDLKLIVTSFMVDDVELWFWPDWSTKNMWSGKTHWLPVWKLQATCTLETTIRKKDLSYLILKCKKACLKLKTIMFSPLGWPCECFLLYTNTLFRCSSQS